MPDRHDLDIEMRRRARAARAEVEADLDAGDALLAAADRGDHPPTPELVRDGGSRRGALVGAAAATVIGIIGAVVLLPDNDTFEIAGGASMTTVPATTSSARSTVPSPSGGNQPSSTTTTAPATSVPATTTTTPEVVAPYLPVGSFDLQPDDLFARHVDGDVYLYRNALGETPSDPVLVIDRPDPRPPVTEGEGPNFIEDIAGTYDGMLIYSDCCEPVSGNSFALAEPVSDRDDRELARLFSLGYEIDLAADGRLVTANQDWIGVVDLASGATTGFSPLGAATDDQSNGSGAPYHPASAAWSAAGTLVVVGLSGVPADDDPAVVLVEHSGEAPREERRRLELGSSGVDEPLRIEIISTGADWIRLARFDDSRTEVLHVDPDTFELLDTDLRPPPPPNAAVIRHSPERGAWAWVADDAGFVQRDGATWRLGDGIADIWFPAIVTTDRMRHVADAENVAVADVSGLAVEEARSILSDAGFVVVEEPVSNPNVAAGVVVVTGPVGGQLAPRGSEVVVYVSAVQSDGAKDWRLMRWEGTGYGTFEPFTQVEVDRDGTAVTLERSTDTLIRHSVPVVRAVVDDDEPHPLFGTYMAELGPDGVVYLAVERGDAGPTDLLAVSLTDGDAGREIDRWVEIDSAAGIGHSALIATRDGVVDSDRFDQLRPLPDAPVLAPWVDRTGTTTTIEGPVLRFEATASALTVYRDDDLPAGTRSWTFTPPSPWSVVNLPDALPTFDGGFIAATYHATHYSVTRGWPDGTTETVVFDDSLSVVSGLDPSGRILVPNGDGFARVEPFDHLGEFWAGRFEIDADTGTLAVPAEWADTMPAQRNPIAFAHAITGRPEVNEQKTIAAVRTGADTWTVTVVSSNFFDDSVFADRRTLHLERDDDGIVRFVNGQWANVCQPGRGHQEFSNALCF